MGAAARDLLQAGQPPACRHSTRPAQCSARLPTCHQSRRARCCRLDTTRIAAQLRVVSYAARPSPPPSSAPKPSTNCGPTPQQPTSSSNRRSWTQSPRDVDVAHVVASSRPSHTGVTRRRPVRRPSHLLMATCLADGRALPPAARECDPPLSRPPNLPIGGTWGATTQVVACRLQLVRRLRHSGHGRTGLFGGRLRPPDSCWGSRRCGSPQLSERANPWDCCGCPLRSAR